MKKHQIITCLLFMAIFSFFASVDAKALTKPQISPAKSTTFELSNGEKKAGSFTVINNGDETFTFSLDVTPYSVVGEQYEDNFTKLTNYNKISNWIEASAEKYTLEAGQSTTVSYKINVPDDVPNGGQYAAIIVRVTSDQENQENVSIIGQLAYLVYAHIAGETRKEGEIKANNIPSFILSSKVNADSLITNTGNIDIDATIDFEVINIQNDETIFENVTNNIRTILPETSRYVSYVWENSPQLGIFKVRQTINYLDKTSTNEKIVVVCPFWLLVIITVFIISAIIWLINNKKNRKITKKEAEL